MTVDLTPYDGGSDDDGLPRGDVPIEPPTLFLVADQVIELVGVVAGHAVTLDEHAELLAKHTKTLRRKSGKITGKPKIRRRSLAGGRLARAQPPEPAPWTLRPAEDPVDREELVTWLDWFATIYPLDPDNLDLTIPAIHQELCALYLWWQAAYRNPRAHPQEPAHWHEALARCGPRLEQWEKLTSARRRAAAAAAKRG